MFVIVIKIFFFRFLCVGSFCKLELGNVYYYLEFLFYLGLNFVFYKCGYLWRFRECEMEFFKCGSGVVWLWYGFGMLEL